uniref:Oxidoreductase-like domain-containing protein n=1 Tax=Meloidogyne floridensis TaxID=298350 RepID=A0A915NG31_9BILA
MLKNIFYKNCFTPTKNTLNIPTSLINITTNNLHSKQQYTLLIQPNNCLIQSTSKLSSDESKNKLKEKNQHFVKAAKFPKAPQKEMCCGSGCPNCVWLQYVDNVLDYVKSLPLDEKVIEEQKRHIRDELEKNVEDENLRMFLTIEIESKGL